MSKILIISLMVLILTACNNERDESSSGEGQNSGSGSSDTGGGGSTGGGDGSSGENSDGEIALLSPKVSVAYNRVTMEVANTVTDVKVIIDDIEYIGVKNANAFLIYNVPLQTGSNDIELVANAGRTKLTVNIDSQGLGTPPLTLELNNTSGFGSLTTQAATNSTDLVISEYLIDSDGDKVIDQTSSTANFQLQYNAQGFYQPTIVIRTNRNILYAATAAQAVNVINNPLSNTTPIGDLTNIQDLEEYGFYTYALSDSSILKISEKDHSQVETINVSGLNNAQGFTFDNEGNMFIADTGNNRVIKLLAANNFQQDSSFSLDASGSNNGQLSSPVDVTIMGTGSTIRVFVLDAGNNRVQVFNNVGAYLAQFDGSTTPQGKLNNPLNMIGAPGVVITDKGNGMLRKITYNENGNTETGKLLVSLSDFGKVTYSSNGLLLFPDNTNNQLTFINVRGETKKQIPTSSSNLIALAFEQNHQLLHVKNNASPVQHMFIPKTAPQGAPKVLAEKFVAAYLANDQTTMLTMTSAQLIEKMKTQDALVREAFLAMTSYRERIYMHGLQAQVTGFTVVSTGQATIKFYFSWSDDQWQLTELI